MVQAGLTKVVQDIFLNEHLRVLQLLKDCDLEQTLNQVLTAIVESAPGSLDNPVHVSSLSSSFLTSVNSKLEQVKDTSRKLELEYIIAAEFSKHVIYILISKSNRPSKELLDQISIGLKAACELRKWDFEQVNKRIQFDLMHVISAKSTDVKSQAIRSNGQSHYTWNGKEEDLSDLAYNLKDVKIVKSANEFKKLFNNTDQSDYSVRIKREEIDLFVILFDELNSLRLITPRGYKAGHFTPIKRHCVDFENNLLLNLDPKRIKQRIVKNTVKYNAIRHKINNWINRYSRNENLEGTMR